MAVYFADTEITGIKDLFPLSSKDITGLYFADTELFTVWDTYDAPLPATYTANGSALDDYRVYGSAGEVGDRTVNLWDESYPGFGITTAVHYEPIYVGSGEFTLSTDAPFNPPYADLFFLSGRVSTGASTNGNSVYIGQSRTIQAIDGYVTIAYRQYDRTHPDVRNYHTMLVEGSTAPAEYVPYGYAVPISVSDGTTSTTTTIYIGDDPLGEDEYVSFEEQKVYRRTENIYNTAETTWSYSNTIKDDDGVEIRTGTSHYTTNFTPCKENTEYYISGTLSSGTATSYRVYFYDSSKAWISRTELRNVSNRVFATPSQCAFLQIQCYYNLTDTSDWEISEGSTAPSTYIPYLQPTDPPVALPALPTCDGTTITDYAGQSAAPSRFYAKYRKEGFK